MTGSTNTCRRRASASLALALFLAGTNYCLVGMVASSFGLGARVSCMAMAIPGSCHGAQRASHCGATAAPSRSDPAPQPAGTAPCCVALAPVLAMQGVKIIAGDIAAALPAAIAAADPAPVPASWHGHRVFRDAGPPPLHSRAPLSPRAPPLA